MSNLLLDTDSYKLGHFKQYPPGTDGLFAYLEARGGRYAKTVFFGLQPILKRMAKGFSQMEIAEAAALAAAHGEPFPLDGWNHILHEYGGHLPLRIRAVPEGSIIPVRNALLTVESTDKLVPWLTTWFETQIMRVWYPTTVCTKSHACVRAIWEYLKETSDDPVGELPFKMHDFGGRGVSSFESAGIGGAAHLVNSLGTDTIAGILHAHAEYGLAALSGGAPAIAGYSIPAMEHSTVTSWGRDGEARAFANMIDQHAGPEFHHLAMVSDSYDIDNAVENIFADELLDKIKACGKTIVIRPDSGDAVEVSLRLLHTLDRKVGCEKNTRGYKVLPKYLRIIWGDGNKDEGDVRRVLHALKVDGFSASNMAFGMGGGLLQLVDRDTCQFAYKVSAAHIDGIWRDVKKEPKTDVHKVSKAGRLDLVHRAGEYKTVVLADGYERHAERDSELVTVFEDGQVKRTYTFDEVRARAAKDLT